MKLALIGSSHAVALKLGFDLLDAKDKAHIDLSFFAAGGQDLLFYRVNRNGVFCMDETRGTPEQREISAKRSLAINGCTELDLNGFDAIWYVGYQIGIEALLRVLPQVQIDDQPSTAPVAGVPDKLLVSSEMITGIGSQYLDRAVTGWPFQKGFQTKVFLCLPPLMFERILRPDVGRVLGRQIQAEIEQNPNYPDMLDAHRNRVDAALSERFNVELVPQPSQTICRNRVLSLETYCEGSETLGGDPHDPTDSVHGNALYGQAVWHSLLPRLSAMN